jgi:hypothetical protein
MTHGPIQFGFQNWSHEYDWWVPNTVPKDFIVGGGKRLPSTHHTQWFDTGIFHPHTDPMEAFNCPVVRRDFLHNYNGPGETVKYSHLLQLAGKKYIFPILIRSAGYFAENKDVGFDEVSYHVFEDVRAGRCRIVLLFPLEGNSGDEYCKEDFAILNSWCIRQNLNKEQVYYVHANHRGVELSEGMNFTYVPIDTFICWVPGLQEDIAEYKPRDHNDLFLCYNRQPRRHRIIMMCEMIRANLLGRGLVSYYGNRIKDTVEEIKRSDRSDLLDQAQQLDDLLPLEIDMDLGENNPAENLVPEHYERTFLSVVPETWYDNNTLFYSEKTWKTLAAGHPFMLSSSYGMLAKLREQGYLTFGTWWDESYDEMTNINDRIRHIVNELNRLGTLSREELVNMRIAMRPTLEHNQKLFNSRYKERCVHREYQLHRIVEDIWNSF